MTKMSDPIEEALAELGREYRDGLPARLAAIRAAVERARERPTEGALTLDALQLVHRLHGTAGSFGLRELGAAAGRLEEALAQVAVDSALAPREAWALVGARLAALIEAESHAQLTGPSP